MSVADTILELLKARDHNKILTTKENVEEEIKLNHPEANAKDVLTELKEKNLVKEFVSTLIIPL